MILSRFLPVKTRAAIRKWVDSFSCERSPTKLSLGDGNSWWIETARLGNDSVVYSAGVGKSISFEKALIEKFGCKVFLYDPSPTAQVTMGKRENQHEDIHFFPVGLAEKSGPIYFAPPADPKEGSFSISLRDETGLFAFDCKDLVTLVKENGHSFIDLLKIDIEGFEYGVLGQALKNNLNIRQICVEFHDFLPGIPKKKTTSIIRSLRRTGYRLIHKVRHDHTFVRD